MSLHYLLDGYNIIKKTPSLADKKLEDGRRALIGFIENQRPQGSLNNRVTVVFDGQPGMWSEPISRTVGVLFSVDATADEKIKALVAKASNKKNIIVVTDDRELLLYVRALGAQNLSVQEFLSQAKCGGLKSIEARQTQRVKGAPSSEAGKNISFTVAHKINLELEEIWLKKNKPQRTG